MKKKLLLLLPMLSFILFFNGCWDYIDYENMTQIYSLGIDLDTDSHKITVTLQFIPITKSSGDKTGSVNKGTVYSASAATFMDALVKLQQASPNKLFFGYLQVIVIGEDAAKYIMKDLTENFERTPNLRSSVSIIVVPGKAEGVIATIDPNSVMSSGRKIRMLLTSYQSNGNVYSVNLHDFLSMMTRDGAEPLASRILTTSENDRGEALGGTRNDIRFAIEKQGNIIASGMAAFKKDKFVGWLNDKETLGLNWILGNKINGYKTSNPNEIILDNNKNRSPLYAEPEKMLFYYITKSGSKIKVKIENNKPVVYLNVKVEASLRKYYSDEGYEYLNHDAIDLIEKNLEISIQSDIDSAIKRGKNELNSDIFGFGFNFYRQHPKKWHKYYQSSWDDKFHDVPVIVNVNAKINNTGSNIKNFFTK